MWKLARDPALIQAQVNCCFSLVLLFEIGWCIYGNTFIFTSGSEQCRGYDGGDVNAYALWVSTMIVICWGYCLMLYLLGIIIFALGLCCIYRSWSLDLTKQLSDQQHRNLSNVPILSTMETYRARRYENNRISRKKR